MTMFVISLFILVTFGLVGYTYTAIRSDTETLKKGSNKLTLVVYIIFGFSFALLTCLSASALIVISTNFYSAGPNLVKLSLITGIFFTLPIITRNLFSHLIFKISEKYRK